MWYQREIFLWDACQLLFISLEMCQTCAKRDMAGCMSSRISRRFFFFSFTKWTHLHKNNKEYKKLNTCLWSTVVATTIHLLLSDSTSIVQAAVSHTVRRGKENDGKGRKNVTLLTIIPGTAVFHIRGQFLIDFVTSESGSVLIGCVHLQSTKLH